MAQTMLTEEELLELAKKEILTDVKCASKRAEIYGAHQWAKPKILIPNKRFIQNMILGGRSVPRGYISKLRMEQEQDAVSKESTSSGDKPRENSHRKTNDSRDKVDKETEHRSNKREHHKRDEKSKSKRHKRKDSHREKKKKHVHK